MSYEKFTQDEMTVIKEVKGTRGRGTEFYDSPITSRENFLRLYQGKTPMWIPSADEVQNIKIDVDPEVIARSSHEGGTDGFGVDWVFVEMVGGATVRPGNPKCPDINEWEKYITIPNPDEWDWEGCYNRAKEKLDPDRLLMIGTSSMLFERLIAILDFGNAALALIDDDQKEAVHRFFRAIVDYRKKYFYHANKWFHPDVINFNDDWGSQRAEFFSKETAKEMLVPYAKELGDYCHELGPYFDLHCCGFVEGFVPFFIEEGFNSWGGQPLNDKAKLKRMYGDKLIFSQEIHLPEGYTDEQLNAEVEKFVREMGDDNRCIWQSRGDMRVRRALYEASRKNYDRLVAEGKAIL